MTGPIASTYVIEKSFNVKNPQQTQIIELPNGLGKIILTVKYQDPHYEARKKKLIEMGKAAFAGAIIGLTIFACGIAVYENFKTIAPQVSSSCTLEDITSQTGMLADEGKRIIGTWDFKNCSADEIKAYLEALKIHFYANSLR